MSTREAEVAGPAGGRDRDPEWTLVKALCRTPEPAEELVPLLAVSDFDRLVGHVLRHRLGPALGALMEVAGAEAAVHPRSRDAVLDLLQLHRCRNRAFTEVAHEVVARFREAGITVAITKGTVLQFLVYRGRGNRMMSDVDLMIHPRDVRAAEAILTDFGGVFGQFDRVSGEVRPLSRERRLVHALSPDHLPDAWVTRDDPVAPAVAVDTAYSVTWAACPWQVDMSAVLATLGSVATTPGSGSGPVRVLPTLDLPWLWIFTLLHLFREAWVLRGVRDNSTSLTQFRDVALLWECLNDADQRRVCDIVADTTLWYPVSWVSHHTDAVLGTRIGEALQTTGTVDPAFWNTAFSIHKEVLAWPGTMEERLRSGEPPTLLSSHVGVDDLLAYQP
jgi:hypothetical protein